ncbi:MAG: hypothetical protein R3Y22_02675 [Bacteroidales bacterium]
MKWNFLYEIAQSVSVELTQALSENAKPCNIWFEVYNDNDYAELSLRVTRWYDISEQLLLVKVIIDQFSIWDDENNNIVIEDDLILLVQLLELNNLIDSSYTY